MTKSEWERTIRTIKVVGSNPTPPIIYIIMNSRLAEMLGDFFFELQLEKSLSPLHLMRCKSMTAQNGEFIYSCVVKGFGHAFPKQHTYK